MRGYQCFVCWFNFGDNQFGELSSNYDKIRCLCLFPTSLFAMNQGTKVREIRDKHEKKVLNSDVKRLFKPFL